jgi:hypothetical protein
MGDPAALEIGQAVPLLWDGNTPIVLALTSDGSVPVAATVVTDNITIENSTFGLRVKPGGVQPWHLSFVPSIEGHTHQDMLQMAGWRVNEAGTIFKGDTRIYDTGQIGLGTGESVIVLDALDLQYRMYSGASDPAYAPFAIMADGSMRATAGTIGGWEIFSNRLANNNIWLDPAGWIKIGFTGITGQNDDNAIYMTSTTDTAWEHDWAFWIGAEYPEDAPFRVTKGGSTWMTDAYIAVNLQSDNYVAGQLGWKLDPTGTLEAQNAIIRGEIRSSVFVSGTTTVTSGKQVVSDATIFVANVGPTDDTIDVAEAAFEVDDMVLVQPDSGRMEWMRITGGPFALTDGAFQYEVLRDLDGTGANQFWEGENIHREGGATYPDPAPLWGDPYALLGFEGPWGGPGFKAMGGFLIYDGSRDTGPYFAVRRRFGASWNQMSDVVRIGRLKGFLGYEIDEYGFGVGSLDSNMFFTQRDGMSLVMGNGQTSINADGVASERFGLWFADTEPGYTDGMVRFWVDQTTRRVYANFKDGAFEEEAVWLDFTSGGSISDNSDMVDGIHASAYVTPNYLLALNSSGKLPTDITGDADTLDNYHASSFSLSDHAHEGDFLTQAEADILYLALAGGTMAGQLNMTDTVKIGFGTSFLQGNASLGRIDIAGTSRLRMLIGADSHIEIESGQIYLNRSVNVMGGYDLIVYSDAGMTEVARIDGATGTYNGVDVGALDDDGGADIIGYDGGYSAGWTMGRMADMAMLVAPTIDTNTALEAIWSTATFLVAGEIYDTIAGNVPLTDDDTNYVVYGESTSPDELSIVLTHDPVTQVLVAVIDCVGGVATVTIAPAHSLLAREAWYLAQDHDHPITGTTDNLVSITTSGGLEDSGYSAADLLGGGSYWTLDTANYLFPNDAGMQVLIGATSGAGAEILHVVGNVGIVGTLDVSGNLGIYTNDLETEALSVVTDTTVARTIDLISKNKTALVEANAIRFYSDNSADESMEYARVSGAIFSPTDGAEQGTLRISTMHGGVLKDSFAVTGGGTGAGNIYQYTDLNTANDVLSNWYVFGRNSAPAYHQYANTMIQATNTTDGTETARELWYLHRSGTSRVSMGLTGGGDEQVRLDLYSTRDGVGENPASLVLMGHDDGGNDTAYATLNSIIESPTGAAESGIMEVMTFRLATQRVTSQIYGGGDEPSTYKMKSIENTNGNVTGQILSHGYDSGSVDQFYGALKFGIVSNTAGAETGYAALGLAVAGADTERWRMTSAGAMMLPEVAAPGTPTSGWGSCYVTTAGVLYFINDAGTNFNLTAGSEWTLDTSNYLFPNLETAMVVIGSTIGSGSEILQVTGDTALYGNLTISGGGTIDLNGSLLTAVSAQIYLSAAGGIPKTTAGCSAPTQIEFATNDQNFYVLDFDSTAQEYADWAFVLPGDYDGTMGMNATFVWMEKSGATSHDVVWGIRGVCYASDDPLDVAEGGTVEITASAGNANDVYFSLQTDSITWAGTPEGGQLIHITVYRNPTDTSDTLDTDARLLGIQLTYTRI